MHIKNKRIPIYLLLAFCWIALLLPVFGGGSAQAKSQRPNLLFILTDDQRFDMMGNITPHLSTPEMDQLVKEGVHFQNAFVTTAICMASRASILSSQYERTHRYTGGAPTIEDRFMENSYPAVLKQNGYRTGYVGKWHVKVSDGMTEKMFDSYLELKRNPYMKTMEDGSLRHLSDITGDKAIEFLNSVKKGEPFCLSVSFNAPHAEDSDPLQYIWPTAFDGLYESLKVPTPPLSESRFFLSLPAFLRYESMNRHRWYWRFDNERKRQSMTKGYYRMISGVDAVIGRIRVELSRLGVADNTVIVFSSDNGYFLGERGWAGKWKPHEVSLRVPLVVYDPRLPAMQRGTKRTEMALNIDIAPTLLELAGLTAPAGWQGRSLLPLVEGKKVENWRKEFFHEFLGLNSTICNYEGLRTEQIKYARYFDQNPVYEELYNLAEDPHEAKNLALVPRQAKLLEDMRKRCDQLRDEYGGPFVPWPRSQRRER